MKKIIMYFNSMAAAGGIERVITSLANEWCKKYTVEILTKDDKAYFFDIDDSINTSSLKCPLRMDMTSRTKRVFAVLGNLLRTRRHLKKYFRENTSDYIYVATPLTAVEIFSLGKEYRKKMVVSEHASKFSCNWIYNRIRNYVYPKVYCLSVPTTLDTQLYKEEGCNAVYIPHIMTYKNRGKNPLDSKIALNIGRFTSDKQQDLLLKIWRNLHVRNHLDGWRLLLIGTGEEKPQLVKYISSNSLVECVSISDPQKDVDEIYQQADLFLFTSKAEGFGMVLLEAMAFGIPCLSFDCPSGPRDIIRQGENGYLIPCFDLSEFEKRIRELINDRKYLKEMGAKAYDTVEKWDNKAILQKWYDIFS